ncbi:hypothetical protein J41TS12_31270 [Paenibacillus antibioticophila]|uniref:Uncharacterized protein n=2 Tax=Paenibacillus TaxID=44249 RepID=A0A919Y3K3_9BACL|nr:MULTISPECIES: hypothetical protein [Paenibacillus]GIO38266.1 hypothetical protein J41TS12_31270 [Paenibacillus antibioticophila]GIO41512.1 hypothetical protein J41TS4_12700 [Paenibacillus apis]
MSDLTEYAKVLRWYVPSSGVTGLRTTITLPGTDSNGFSSQIGGSNGSGFINFYLAGDAGKVTLPDGRIVTGHYECGLSQSFAEALKKDKRWHWFYTEGYIGDDGGEYALSPGTTWPIELSISNSNLLVYKVNGVVTKQFTTGPYTSLSNARLVVAACDKVYPSEQAVPTPLDNWNTLHNQVTCANIQYRNTSGNWITCTPSNSTPPTSFGTGKASDELHWPKGKTHVGTPKSYIMQISNGQLIASLKRF